jgi:hypothetical protein
MRNINNDVSDRATSARFSSKLMLSSISMGGAGQPGCFPLRALRGFARAVGTGYRFSFRNSAGDEIPIEETLPARIKGLLSPPEEEEELHTVPSTTDPGIGSIRTEIST